MASAVTMPNDGFNLVPCIACAVRVANSGCFRGHANTLCHSTLLKGWVWVLLFVDASCVVRIRRTANLHGAPIDFANMSSFILSSIVPIYCMLVTYSYP